MYTGINPDFGLCMGQFGSGSLFPDKALWTLVCVHKDQSRFWSLSMVSLDLDPPFQRGPPGFSSLRMGRSVQMLISFHMGLNQVLDGGSPQGGDELFHQLPLAPVHSRSTIAPLTQAVLLQGNEIWVGPRWCLV